MIACVTIDYYIICSNHTLNVHKMTKYRMVCNYFHCDVYIMFGANTK